MRAGFIRRTFSALIDLSLVIAVVYLAFTLVGKGILQNNIEYFDEIDYNLQEVSNIQTDNISIINQRNTTERNQEISVINHLASLDQRVYQDLLFNYYNNTITFFLIGISVLIILLVTMFKGLTPGRRLMNIELVGDVSIKNIIIHDLLLKYILVVILIMFNLYYAFIILPIYFLIDMFLIILSKNKTTLRDSLSNITLNYKPRKPIEKQF